MTAIFFRVRSPVVKEESSPGRAASHFGGRGAVWILVGSALAAALWWGMGKWEVTQPSAPGLEEPSLPLLVEPSDRGAIAAETDWKADGEAVWLVRPGIEDWNGLIGGTLAVVPGSEGETMIRELARFAGTPVDWDGTPVSPGGLTLVPCRNDRAVTLLAAARDFERLSIERLDGLVLNAPWAESIRHLPDWDLLVEAKRIRGMKAGEEKGHGTTGPGGFGAGAHKPFLSLSQAFHFSPNSAQLDLEHPENRVELERLRRMLESVPGSMFVLEGHANPALAEESKADGERAMAAMDLGKARARAVRKALIALGADGNRIETMGRGWEPVAETAITAAWYIPR